jgi:hypothetical protein
MKSKGLGDTVEKVTKATGLKKATDFIFNKLGVDCGCDKRKEKLNKLFPYKKPECLTEEEYMVLKGFFKRVKSNISASEQTALLDIYNRVFKQNRQPSTCGSCVKELVNDMKTLFKEYEQEQEAQTEKGS